MSRNSIARWLGRLAAFAVASLALGLSIAPAAAEKRYGPGASDTEIKLGQTMAYSGPASSLATIGRTAAAFYRRINDEGGINGRKIVLSSVDDGYSPPKTVEQTRRLVEQEQVLAIVTPLGTPTSAAVQRYLNDRKVPQLFVLSGAERFRDPRGFPWTLGADVSYVSEARVFARYIRATAPQARIAVLYQNDDYGKDHLAGLRAELGDKAGMIAGEASYETTDPTVDSQIVALKASGADALLTAGVPKFTAQAIRKVYDIGWKPLHVIAFPAASIPATLQPAGLEKSVGLVTAEFVKQAGDPAWADDPEMQAYLAFMARYNPDADPADHLNILAYYNSAAVAELLRRCGDDLTRESLMHQATHMERVRVPMLLPGITLNTSPSDYAPVKQMRLQRFDGQRWVPFGELLGD